jgi:hypothetical protein
VAEALAGSAPVWCWPLLQVLQVFEGSSGPTRSLVWVPADHHTVRPRTKGARWAQATHRDNTRRKTRSAAISRSLFYDATKSIDYVGGLEDLAASHRSIGVAFDSPGPGRMFARRGSAGLGFDLIRSSSKSRRRHYHQGIPARMLAGISRSCAPDGGQLALAARLLEALHAWLKSPDAFWDFHRDRSLRRRFRHLRPSSRTPSSSARF